MNEDRLERYVRAAVRGIMEAVLSLEPTDETPRSKTQRRAKARQTPTPQEIPFPSVSHMEDTLFEDLPESNVDMDMALEALARARKLEEASAAPVISPGPGESETSESWRIPQ